MKKIGSVLLAAVLVFILGTGVGCAAAPDDFKPQGIEVPTDPGAVATSAVGIAFFVAAVLTFFYLMYGGIGIITSGGDSGKLQTARGRMLMAVLGLLILSVVWAIYSLVLYVAGFGEEVKMPTLSSELILFYGYNLKEGLLC